MGTQKGNHVKSRSCNGLLVNCIRLQIKGYLNLDIVEMVTDLLSDFSALGFTAIKLYGT